jgi:putative MATE family efflux protein
VASRVEEAPLVEGSLWKAIWTMSWPLTLTTIATSICGMVDVQCAGYLGPVSQAAVGLAEQVIFLFMVFIMSLGVGTTAIVSRVYGERDAEQTTYASGQSLALSIMSGLVLTVLALLTARYLLPLFSESPQVVAASDRYLSTFALYMVPWSIVAIANSIFRSLGNAKIPLLVMTVEVLVNVIGDYATVRYNWPVRGLGINGIAWSAVTGSVCAAATAIMFIKRTPAISTCFQHMTPLSKDAIMRVLNIGVPSGFRNLSWTASVFAIFFILKRLSEPTAALASWTIGMRVEGLLFMPLMALSLAASSIIGQNLGAKQTDRAFRAGWHITWTGVVMMLVLATLLYAFAPQCAAFMTRDPATIAITAQYLRINALAEPFLAVNMVLNGALQGAGDTTIPMWISIVSNWLIRLPLAWLLSLQLHYDAAGTWAAMAASIVLSSLVIAWRYQTGVWIHQKV